MLNDKIKSPHTFHLEAVRDRKFLLLWISHNRSTARERFLLTLQDYASEIIQIIYARILARKRNAKRTERCLISLQDSCTV